MTGRHKNRGLNFRPDPDLKERFKAATQQADTTMAAELTAFVRWYVGDTDELPRRIDQEPQTARQLNEKDG